MPCFQFENFYSLIPTSLSSTYAKRVVVIEIVLALIVGITCPHDIKFFGLTQNQSLMSYL